MEIKGLKETEEAVDNLRDRFSDLEDEVDQMYIDCFDCYITKPESKEKARRLRGFFMEIQNFHNLPGELDEYIREIKED